MLVAELLDQLAHVIPDLHDAACRGRAEVFDIEDGRRDRQQIARARAICQSCPVLGDCRDWLASLPRPARPSGVVAGRYVAPPPLSSYVPRPRAPSAPERATVWLRAYLAQHGPVLSTQVIAGCGGGLQRVHAAQGAGGVECAVGAGAGSWCAAYVAGGLKHTWCAPDFIAGLDALGLPFVDGELPVLPLGLDGSEANFVSSDTSSLPNHRALRPTIFRPS